MPGLKTTVGLQDFLKLHPDVTAVKMDIEGSEVQIVEQMRDWGNVRYLVFEWHFDRRDQTSKLNGLSRFRSAMSTLARHFDVVSNRSIPLEETHWIWNPPATVVVCYKQSLAL